MDEQATLLLVGAEPDEAKLVLRTLAALPGAGEVLAVRDADEAIDYMACAGHPRLVLLGLGINSKADCSLGTLQRIRSEEKTSRVPVVLFSEEREDLIEAYGLGANACVRTPSEPEELAEAMRKTVLFWLVKNVPPPDQPPEHV